MIQSRTDKKSTIYCSQWAPEGWLGKLGDGPLADAILDRIRNSSYTILLKGRSLRGFSGFAIMEYSRISKQIQKI